MSMTVGPFESAPRPFSRVMVANRGEIAVRILKAAREAGLGSVAVFSDADASSLHVEGADEAVHIPGESLAETYLNSEALISAALSSGADAIHPGYGFLSERSDFAVAVVEAGLVWIGPPAEAISTMGDKISARVRMIESGVQVIPGEELTVPDGADHLGVLASCAARVGYPLLLKASAGGGGKGMREVREPKLLRTEYEAASREASAAFGDGTIYVEHLLTGARHVEVQILADSHGSCIHLNERDCSLQRRHQKVLEEAPSPAVDSELRQAMGATAVKAAQAVGYEGAGTVEFLLSSSDDFYFLEMNTRLQVEHPVTEMTTGIDLVLKQFEVAAGLPLGIVQDDIGISGHAIEARVYAEDAARGFLPCVGRLSTWKIPQGPGIRVDTGVRQGDTVTIDFDPMLAKLIVHAPSRPAALRRLDTALSDLIALGVTTNIDFLRDVAAHHAFASGSVTTDFLDSSDVSALSMPEADPAVLVAVACASQRLGLERAASAGDLEASDEHTGHSGDPFRTLTRSFP